MIKARVRGEWVGRVGSKGISNTWVWRGSLDDYKKSTKNSIELQNYRIIDCRTSVSISELVSQILKNMLNGLPLEDFHSPNLLQQ